MDDSEKLQKKQSPVFQTVPIDEVPKPLKAEEVASDIQTPEEIRGSIPPSSYDDIPVYQENQSKIPFIIGIILFFLVVFAAVFWFFFRDRFQSNTTPVVTKKDPVTLVYWGLWDEEAVYQPLIDEYTKKNPHVTIKYEKTAPKEYRTKLLARSKTGNGPDIFRYHNTWVPQIRDVLTAIPSEVMTAEQFDKTFYPIHKKDLKVGEAYYGLPLMVDGLVLMYNEDILKQGGFVAPPSIWVGDQTDMLTQAAALTVRDSQNSIVTAGVAIGTASNVEHFGEIFGTLLILNGGDFKHLEAPQATEALQLYRKFAEDSIWPDSMSNSIPAFIEGKAAMIFAPSWQILVIKGKNPQLPLKVAPVPKGLNNAAASVANYWVEGVNRYSKSQNEAWLFLNFLVQKDSLSKMYKTQTATRPVGIAYSRTDMADLLKDNEFLAPVINQAKTDVYVSLPLASRTYDGGLNDEVLQYLTNAINDTAKGVDYAAALQTAKQGIDTLLSKYNIE